MMLTFRLTALCQGCGTEITGAKLAFPKRINLGSIVVENSITYLDRRCGCDRNQPRQPVEVLETRMTAESAVLVEQARAKIRARRKQKVA